MAPIGWNPLKSIKGLLPSSKKQSTPTPTESARPTGPAPNRTPQPESPPLAAQQHAARLQQLGTPPAKLPLARDGSVLSGRALAGTDSPLPRGSSASPAGDGSAASGSVPSARTPRKIQKSSKPTGEAPLPARETGASLAPPNARKNPFDHFFSSRKSGSQQKPGDAASLPPAREDPLLRSRTPVGTNSPLDPPSSVPRHGADNAASGTAPAARVPRKLQKKPPSNEAVGSSTSSATTFGPFGDIRSHDRPRPLDTNPGIRPVGEAPARAALALEGRLAREPDAFLAQPEKKGLFKRIFARGKEASRATEVSNAVRDMGTAADRARAAGETLQKASHELAGPLTELRQSQAQLKEVLGGNQRIDGDVDRLRKAERMSARLEYQASRELQALQKDGLLPAGLSIDARTANSAPWLASLRTWGDAGTAELQARAAASTALPPDARGALDHALDTALSQARAAAGAEGAHPAGRFPVAVDSVVQALAQQHPAPGADQAMRGWAQAADRLVRAESAALAAVAPPRMGPGGAATGAAHAAPAPAVLDDPRALRLCRSVLDAAAARAQEAELRAVVQAHGPAAQEGHRAMQLQQAQERVDKAEQAIKPASARYAAARASIDQAMHPEAMHDVIRGYMVTTVEAERRTMAQRLIDLHLADLQEAVKPGDNGSLSHLKRRQAHAQSLEADAQEKWNAAEAQRAALRTGPQRPGVAELRRAYQHSARASFELREARALREEADGKLVQARADLRRRAPELEQAASRLAAAQPVARSQADMVKGLAATAEGHKQAMSDHLLQAMREHPPGFSPQHCTQAEWSRLQLATGRMLDKLPPDDPTAERETPRVIKAQVLLRNVALAADNDPRRAAEMLEAVMAHQPRHWMHPPDAAEADQANPATGAPLPRQRQLHSDVAGLHERMVNVERGIAFMGDIAREDKNAGFDPVATYFRARQHAREQPDEASREMNRGAMRYASDMAHGRLPDPPVPTLDRAAYGAVAQGYTSKAPGSAYEQIAKGLGAWSDDQSPANANRKSSHPWASRRVVKALRNVQEELGRATVKTRANDAVYEAAGRLTWAARRGELMPEAAPAAAAQADADHAVLASLGKYITEHGQRHGRASSWVDQTDKLHLTTRSFNRHQDLSDPRAKLRSTDFKRIVESARADEYRRLRADRTEAEGAAAVPETAFRMSPELQELLSPNGRWKNRSAAELLDVLGRHLAPRAAEPFDDIYNPADLNRTVLKGSTQKLVTSESRLAEATEIIRHAEERMKISSSRSHGVAVVVPAAASIGLATVGGAAKIEATTGKQVVVNVPSFGADIGGGGITEVGGSIGGFGGLGVKAGDFKLMPVAGSVRGSGNLQRSDVEAGVRVITGKKKAGEQSPLAIGERKVDERNQALADMLEQAAHWRDLTVQDGKGRAVYLEDPLQTVLAFRPEAPVFAEHRSRLSGTGGLGVETAANAGLTPELSARVGGGALYTANKTVERSKDSLSTQEKSSTSKRQVTASAGAGIGAKPVQHELNDDVKVSSSVPVAGVAAYKVLFSKVTKHTGNQYATPHEKRSGSKQIETSNPRKIEGALKDRVVDSLLRIVDANKLQKAQTEDDLLRLGMDQYEAFMERFGSMRSDVTATASLKHEQLPTRTGDPAGYRALAQTYEAEGKTQKAIGALAASRSLEQEPDFWSIKTAAIKHAASQVDTQSFPPVGLGIARKTQAAQTAVYPGEAFPPVRGLPRERAPDLEKGILRFESRGLNEPRRPLNAFAPELPQRSDGSEPPASPRLSTIGEEPQDTSHIPEPPPLPPLRT